jgi:hypothetical protein
MPDSKNLNWAEDYAADGEAASDVESKAVATPEPAANDAQPAANDPDGWEQYRQWVSKAPAPRARRVGIDPSLYTWKGYRTWSEQVKRNWDSDVDEDID